MDCPSCGRANASELVECKHCQALLVDVFASATEDNQRTDPIELIGGSRVTSADTDALLRAAREITDDEQSGPHESLSRFPTSIEYTGDLPRLFRFGDRYQILEKLGEGGMGRVYKALDLELDRPVALKTIRAEKGTGPEVQERFKQELILARKVTHKNVIRIYDLGESEGMKFFTMELIEGKSLRDILREKTKVPVKESLSFMTQMLHGLTEAHSQGVVHRDLKPQNIMVDGSGIVRIMDFGIARTADSATMTGTGEMMGTPDYISPEQVKGETADAQSDLYSCGVILYELLTGETPFKGDTPISKIVARIQAKPQPPRELNPDIPSYLERIILKCLEVDPELRYASAEEVLQDLEREQVDSSLWLRTRKAFGRHRGLIAAALVAGAIALFIWASGKTPDPTVAADVPVPTIAVLPFTNVTGDEELAWMENGIPEMLITDISQLRSLRPVMAERMNNILRDLGKEGQSRFDDEIIELITQMAAADHVLYGRFAHSEGELRVNLTLRDTETGIPTPINIKTDASRIFALVDTLTEEVTKTLNLDEETLPFGAISTPFLPAFRAYQQGMTELRNGSNQAAIPLLQKAIEIDESFAIAHARLAEVSLNLGDRELAKQQSEIATALALEREIPLAERYQIHAIAARADDDPQKAVDSYRKLSELYPEDPDVLLGLASSWDNLGDTEEAANVYRRVLDVAPNYGAAMLGLGMNLVDSGQSEEAVPLLEKAIASGHFSSELESLGMIHSILGRANRGIQNYDSALAYFEQSLEYRRQAHDYRGITASLTNLATTYSEVNRLEEAKTALDEALELSRERRIPEMESFALLNLGNLALEMGDLVAAYSNYRDSLDIAWELGQNDEIAYRLDAMAEVYRLSGRYTEAMVYLEQARQHLEKTELPNEEAYNLSVRGHILKARGQYNEAIQNFLTSLPVLATSDYSRDTAYAQQALTEIYIQQARFAEALAVIDQASQNPETQNRAVLATTWIQRAQILLLLGDIDAANEALVVGDKLVADAARFEDRPFFDLVRGQYLRAKKEYEQAEESLNRAVLEARQRGRAEMAGRAAVELASLYLDLGMATRAEATFREAYSEASRYRHRAIQAAASLGLAEALLQRQQVSKAEVAATEAEEIAASFGGKPIVARSSHQRGIIAAKTEDSETASRHYSDAREKTLQIAESVPESYRESFREVEPWKTMLAVESN